MCTHTGTRTNYIRVLCTVHTDTHTHICTAHTHLHTDTATHAGLCAHLCVGRALTHTACIHAQATHTRAHVYTLAHIHTRHKRIHSVTYKQCRHTQAHTDVHPELQTQGTLGSGAPGRDEGPVVTEPVIPGPRPEGVRRGTGGLGCHWLGKDAFASFEEAQGLLMTREPW